MKHKRFNEALPYTYLLVRKSDNLKYHGVRYANTKLGLSPEEDFGKKYFTSGKLRKEFKKHPERFEYTVKWTFDTVDEALSHEYQVNKRIFLKDDWANMCYGKNFGEHPDIGSLISASRTKDVVEQGVKALKDFLYNTEEGTQIRYEISERKKAFWKDKTHSEKLEILKAAHETLTQEHFDKLHEWRREVVDDKGTTRNHLICRKSAETRAKNGTNSIIGKKRNEIFNEKLKAMTDEEFAEWCEWRTPRAINGATTRRNK